MLTEGAASIRPATVHLADGHSIEIDDLTAEQLHVLQWEQEQAFAAAILKAPMRSPERQEIVEAAYDALGAIMSARADRDGTGAEQVNLGSRDSYVDLVLQLLAKQRKAFGEPSMFEIGFGSGALLHHVAAAGYTVAGIEVSDVLRDQARRHVDADTGRRLLLGNMLDADLASVGFRPSLVYWNDVMEHIAPDEIALYLKRIHEFLAPGGMLVTVTPNWLMRPCDVTRDFCPPRTQSRGLHLKEYRLSEVVRLLKGAGFARVTSPLGAARGKYIVSRFGMTPLKCLIEPLLDRAPLGTMRTWESRLALSCSIAVKASR